MIYTNASQWLAAPHKRICVFGMSGLGKTHMANMLRASGQWYHYSVDYRIGTRYLGEAITDNAKRAAMQVPLLRDLLLSDSIYIGSNITFDNLAPLSSYLGKPGDPEKGGLNWDDYRARQEKHRKAEIKALLDTEHFITRAQTLYDYPHFICDTGGSVCEVIDFDDENDPVLAHLRGNALLIWLKGDEHHKETLIKRFDAAPKPIYYAPDLLLDTWHAYLDETGETPQTADPDAFIRYGYARLLDHRQPLYAKMAEHGITLTADELHAARDPHALIDLIASKLP